MKRQVKMRGQPRHGRAKVQVAASNRPRLTGVTGFFSQVPDWVILLSFCALILLETIPSIWQESATFDEVQRQLPGYLHLTAGEFRLHTEHPPLIKMLTALPLLFLDVKSLLFRNPGRNGPLVSVKLDFSIKLNDADQLVFLGRLAVLPLTLLLGYFVFRWSKEASAEAPPPLLFSSIVSSRTSWPMGGS